MDYASYVYYVIQVVIGDNFLQLLQGSPGINLNLQKKMGVFWVAAALLDKEFLLIENHYNGSSYGLAVKMLEF